MTSKLDIKGIDFVAGICICVCGALVYCGHDGAIISLLATVVGYYFGTKKTINGGK